MPPTDDSALAYSISITIKPGPDAVERHDKIVKHAERLGATTFSEQYDYELEESQAQGRGGYAS